MYAPATAFGPRFFRDLYCMRTRFVRYSLIGGLLALLIVSGVVTDVAAQSYGLKDTARLSGYNQNQDIYGLIGAVVNIILGSLSIIFFGLVLFAGVRWMTANGREEYIEKAKSILSASVIGLVVVLSAYGISTFIINRLQVRPPTDPNQELLDANTTGPRSQLAQSCYNKLRDGTETDTDCGGSCDACKDGRVCTQNKDCVSNNCQNGSCMPGGSSCTNGVKDGLESDTDCGGTVCSPCGAGRKCTTNSDCVNGNTCGMNTKTCGGS